MTHTRFIVVFTLISLSTACAYDVRSDGAAGSPPAAVGLAVLSARWVAPSELAADPAPGDRRVLVEMELANPSASASATLALGAFLLETTAGLQHLPAADVGQPGACRHDTFVTAGASVECAIPFDVPEGASLTDLVYMGAREPARAEVPPVAEAPHDALRAGCEDLIARVYASSECLSCVSTAGEDAAFLSGNTDSGACDGVEDELDQEAVLSCDVDRVSEACAVDLNASLDRLMERCATECPAP